MFNFLKNLLSLYPREFIPKGKDEKLLAELLLSTDIVHTIKKNMPGGHSIDTDHMDNIIVSTDLNSPLLFCSHHDTCYTEFEKLYINKNRNLCTNNVSILGADDRAGVFILLKMIAANIPGTYIFHALEECGAKGANYIACVKYKFLRKFKICIEFDRRGKHSIVTNSLMMDTCSKKFTKFLSKLLGKLKYFDDKSGIYTDNTSYVDDIPEIVNLSCGYFHPHSKFEELDYKWLINDLAPIVCDPSFARELTTYSEGISIDVIQNVKRRPTFRWSEIDDYEFKSFGWLD